MLFNRILLSSVLILALLCTACSGSNALEPEGAAVSEELPEGTEETSEEKMDPEVMEELIESHINDNSNASGSTTELDIEEGNEEFVETGQKEISDLGITDGVLKYEDVHGYIFRTPVYDHWLMNDYDQASFKMVDGRMTYESDKYTFRLGIDVFNQYGTIDWDKVKDDGYEFAIIRAGYRGYSYPDLVRDENIFAYMHGAVNAGLDLGVYFFSQAITEEEAEEEAEFVISLLQSQGCMPENLVMGVAYDPESIGKWSARTSSLTKDQATKNAAAFCRIISEEGYKPLIYSNMVWEDRYFDLSQLSDYEIWYADYTAYPQTPYAFSIWQYGHGESDGVEGAVDVNIQLIPVE